MTMPISATTTDYGAMQSGNASGLTNQGIMFGRNTPTEVVGNTVQQIAMVAALVLLAVVALKGRR